MYRINKKNLSNGNKLIRRLINIISATHSTMNSLKLVFKCPYLCGFHNFKKSVF